jgi:hypothetical protein
MKSKRKPRSEKNTISLNIWIIEQLIKF